MNKELLTKNATVLHYGASAAISAFEAEMVEDAHKQTDAALNAVRDICTELTEWARLGQAHLIWEQMPVVELLGQVARFARNNLEEACRYFMDDLHLMAHEPLKRAEATTSLVVNLAGQIQ